VIINYTNGTSIPTGFPVQLPGGGGGGGGGGLGPSDPLSFAVASTVAQAAGIIYGAASNSTVIVGSSPGLVQAYTLDGTTLTAGNSISVGSIQFPGLDIQGDTLFVADTSGNALVSVDITDPSAIATLDTVAVVGGPKSVRANGDYVYVGTVISSSQRGYSVVDATDQSNMSVVETFYNATLLRTPYSIDIVGDNLFSIQNITDSVSSVNISNPLSLTINSSVQTRPELNDPRHAGIDRDNGFIVTVTASGYITSVDITTDPLTPTVLNALFMGATYNPSGAAYVAPYFYTTAFASPVVRIFDLTDPSSIVEMPSVDLSAGINRCDFITPVEGGFVMGDTLTGDVVVVA
jgi:hypothetical protein